MSFNTIRLIRIVPVLVLLHFCAYAETNVRTSQTKSVIIDSAVTFEEAIGSQKVPHDVRANLVLINVKYYSFDGRERQGQLVVHKDLSSDLTDIFSN